MEESLATKVFLPLALAIVMFGMGLSLKKEDFMRVFQRPKAIAIGLMNQLILLPLVAFLIASTFTLEPAIAVGLILIAACPGGATSNLITHLSNGDSALSISLTAVSTVITLVSVPFIVGFGYEHFAGVETTIAPPVVKFVGVLAITIIPVLIGMAINKSKPDFAKRMEKTVKITSAVILAVVILGAVLKEKANLGAYFEQAGLVALILNVVMMFVGFTTAKIFSLNRKESITVSIETGIQNGTLAINIAYLVYDNSAWTITPAVYSLIMFATAGFMIAYFGSKKSGSQATA